MMQAYINVSKEFVTLTDFTLQTEAERWRIKFNWAKGFLFTYDEKFNGYRIDYFQSETGSIFIKVDITDDAKTGAVILEEAIESNQLLNHHAELLEYTTGLGCDDFVNNKITVKLTYKFK